MRAAWCGRARGSSRPTRAFKTSRRQQELRKQNQLFYAGAVNFQFVYIVSFSWSLSDEEIKYYCRELVIVFSSCDFRSVSRVIPRHVALVQITRKLAAVERRESVAISMTQHLVEGLEP